MLVTLSATAAVAVASCGNRSPSAPAGCNKVQPAGFPLSGIGVNLDDTAPDFRLKDLDGKDVCLRDYTGSLVLISVGTGWCVPCQLEVPGIQNTYVAFQSSGFVVLMAMMQDDAAAPADDAFVLDWKNRYGLTFPLMADPGQLSYNALIQPGESGAIPLDVVVNRDQRVIFSVGGGMTEAFIHNLVQGQVGIPASLPYGTPPP